MAQIQACARSRLQQQGLVAAIRTHVLSAPRRMAMTVITPIIGRARASMGVEILGYVRKPMRQVAFVAPLNGPVIQAVLMTAQQIATTIIGIALE